MTFLLAIISGLVVYWQGQQLRKQLELQVLTEIIKEWNSDYMCKARSKVADVIGEGANSDTQLDKVEVVLEFFERIASYYLNRVLSSELIWDTIGWYILRYFVYLKPFLCQLRQQWGDDKTLYTDVEKLYHSLSGIEIHRRKMSHRRDLESNLRQRNQLDKFIKFEKTVDSNT